MSSFKHMTACPLLLFMACVFITLYLTSSAAPTVQQCNRTLLGVFESMFIHYNASHLSFTLIGLYLLLDLERDLGTINLFFIVGCIATLCSALEFALINVTSFFPCNTGFGSVVIALAIVDLAISAGFNLRAIFALLVVLLYPNLMRERTSLSGQLIGVLVGGAVASLFLSQMRQCFCVTTKPSSRRKHATRLRIFNPLDTDIGKIRFR